MFHGQRRAVAFSGRAAALLILGTLLVLNTSPGQAQPGHVYLVVGSDTAIWNTPTTVDVYTRHPHYSQDSFTLTNAPSYQVMDATWRSQYRDSYQQPIKFTWWMMGGNIYRDADNLNVPTPNTMALYLMRKYHGEAIRQFGDELSLHYHTFFWSDYNQDGIFHWNQSRTFNECRSDWDVTLAQYLLEEGVFPASFRSGWHFMDTDWQGCLDELIPYCFHDDFGAFRAWSTNEPIAGVEDWLRAPSTFIPFHPSTNDYEIPGDSPGWNVRSIKMQNLVQADLNYAFGQASNGVDQVVCLWSHLPENFVAMIAKTGALLEQAVASHPNVPFRYCTAVEAMQRWQGVMGQAPPQLTIQEVDQEDQSVTLIISADKPIFQPKPFVAVRDAWRRYSNVTSLCVPGTNNTWTVRLPTARTALAKVGIAVTDGAGNSATRILRFLPDDLYLDNLDPQYSERAGAWTSTTNAAWGTDARVALLTSNETAQARWVLPVSASGAYSLATQIPSLTNACTNVSFRVLGGNSVLASASLGLGLHPDQWNFLCSVMLDAGETNVLEINFSGTNQPNSQAAADVVSVIPLVADPGLPPPDQMVISAARQGVVVQFRGNPGWNCEIQRTGTLGGAWATLDTLPVPLTGLLEYEDAHPPDGTAFYRVTRLPPKP